MTESRRSKRSPWIDAVIIGGGLVLILALWFLTLPRPHAAINESNFARIKAGMNRKDVEALLAGPPRIETSDPKIDVWNKLPKADWGRSITPGVFRSIISLDATDSARLKQGKIDLAIAKEKGADIAENGLYLLAWHHDLATITVVFDGQTDEVKGATLWAPEQKSWREHPPFRWFW